MTTSLLIYNNKEPQLETLRNHVCACVRCGLAVDRTQTVFGEGNLNARVMLIGEAPGAEEDKQGRPFVGRAGRLLDSIIEACGWKREDVYIANILKCRPPKNRVPEAVEIYNCSNFLERQIAIVNPEFILCLGSVASNTIVGLPVNEARGQWFYHKHHKVLCTYHPAYLLRNQGAKRHVWNDLQLLLKAINDASADKAGSTTEGNCLVGHSTAEEHCCEAT